MNTRVQSGALLSDFRLNFTYFFHLHSYRWEDKIKKLGNVRRAITYGALDVLLTLKIFSNSLLCSLCCVLLKELELITHDCYVVIVRFFFGFSLYLKENSVAITKTDDVDVPRFPRKVPVIFALI
jgi:hypothetical protein